MNEESKLTPELYRTIVSIVDDRVKEIRVTREDFNRVEAALNRLSEAQARTEERVTRLEEAVTRLSDAQARTEERITQVEERATRLEDAVTRLEEAVTRLSEAQARTEERVTRLEDRTTRLEQAVEKLARTQASFERTFHTQMGALGARWGLYAEESFRDGMRAILEEVGFKAERYVAFDHAGKVFDQPEQVELDLVVHNGKLMLIEIKSSVSRGDMAIFNRKIGFYEEREGKRADRRVAISPFVEEKAKKLATDYNIEVYAQPDELAGS